MIAAIALGSNTGDKLANLKAAVAKLAEIGRVQAVSGVYLTAPWGFEEQDDFLNAALVVDLPEQMRPLDLLRRVKQAEIKIGRTPCLQKWGPRAIDIDILTIDDIELESDELTLPHPRMMERLFVLAPLAELIPAYQETLGAPALAGQRADRVAGCEALVERETGRSGARS